MNVNLDELGKKLHAKLDQGIGQLKTTKAHLEDLQKEAEVAILEAIAARQDADES